MKPLPPTKNAASVSDYIYFDERLIDRYVEQIHSMVEEVTNTDYEASVSLVGPSIKASKKKKERPLNKYEKLTVLKAFLGASGDLSNHRPIQLSVYNEQTPPRFVIETMTATKVVLPVIENTELRGLKSVTLWVSDPDPSLYSAEPYVWRGSFLYLTAFQWDGEWGHFHSGISALQLLVNLSQGRDFLSFVKEEFEPFGRGRDLHPVDKLKEIGAVSLGTRKITSLYRVRYFSNEQVYSFEGERRRLNDIAGYPLFIAAED